LLVVLLAQMGTVPVASVMVGRAAFRRGFVRGGDYAFDELSDRLADADDDDDDDDEDGFLDDHEGMAHDAEDRFPEHVGQPEPEAVGTAGVDIDSLDVDLEDETEREAEEVAERDPRP